MEYRISHDTEITKINLNGHMFFGHMRNFGFRVGGAIIENKLLRIFGLPNEMRMRPNYAGFTPTQRVVQGEAQRPRFVQRARRGWMGRFRELRLNSIVFSYLGRQI